MAHIRTALLVVITLAVAFMVIRLWRMAGDPDIPLLIDGDGAAWICFDAPPHLPAQKPQQLVTFFRKTVQIDDAPVAAPLVVRCFRLGNLQIDGVQALGPWEDLSAQGEATVNWQSALSKWKQPRHVDIAQFLRPGKHQIVVEVLNQNAPCALLASCPAIGLGTDQTWEASMNGQDWTPVRLAASPRWAEVTAQFSSSVRAFGAGSLWLALPFVLALGIALYLTRGNQTVKNRIVVAAVVSPCTVRWGLLAAWIALAINNIWKLPADVGFDVQAHLAYVLFIHHYGTLPLATDGWQMFEAPLYYLLSLPILKFTISPGDLEPVIKAMRVIPFLCALAQTEICYRVMRLVFGHRRDLCVVGLVTGALLPMLLYRSQTIGTEPMAGALTAATIWLGLAYAYGSQGWRTWKGAAAIGFAFGLALLTKVSAVLLAPLLIGWLASVHWINGDRLRVPVQRVAIIMAVAAMIAGWYYTRNWIELGKPFVGGWDPSRNIDWWQEPGYRTPAEFLRFGRAINYPVWASMAGFWDGLYSTMWTDGMLSSMVLYDHRPPWNYRFVLSGSLLALFPCTLMLIGALSAIVVNLPSQPPAGPDAARPTVVQASGAFIKRGALLFSVLAIATYLMAIFDLHLTAPIHSTAKATYTLGLTPCYAMLMAAGFGVAARWSVLRAVLVALLATWCVNSFLAYFIV